MTPEPLAELEALRRENARLRVELKEEIRVGRNRFRLWRQFFRESRALKEVAQKVIEDCEAVGVIPFHLDELRALLDKERQP